MIGSQVFEGDEQIDDFLQSRNEFTLIKSSLEHEESVPAKDKDHEIELPSFTDINLLRHPYEAEMFEDLDQKDLEVLQCKNDTLPRGLAPLEELFEFNDVAKKPKI